MGYYKICFKPAEPYFLGNEKSFKYPGQKNGGEYANSYFIRSENTPSQTTILGALRFLLLPCIKEDFNYTEDEKKKNADAVGKSGFQIGIEEMQTFGWIKQISPVFLSDNQGSNYIPCPMDHVTGNSSYTPFNNYKEILTSSGKKLYTESYNSKDGLMDGYLCLETKNVVSSGDIFEPSMRIGINRANKADGFFKKEYKMLDRNYAFSVYAEIESENQDIVGTHVVTMGQGKSPFAVSITEPGKTIDEFKNEVVHGLDNYNRSEYSMVYCFGDAFVECNPCIDTVFAAYETRDYRSFERSAQSEWKVKKGSTLYRTLKAGSVFLVDDSKKWIDKHSRSNAEQIGFNNFVIVGGK